MEEVQLINAERVTVSQSCKQINAERMIEVENH